MELWSSRGMLRERGRGGGMEIWRSRAREACCRPGDVEARGGMEISSSRDMLEARGRGGGMEVWRYRGLGDRYGAKPGDPPHKRSP